MSAVRRTRVDVVRENVGDALPRSDSAMTLRAASPVKSGGEVREGTAEEVMAPPEDVDGTFGRRWYTRVRVYNDGCTLAVADAELAMLEASILSMGDAPSACASPAPISRWTPSADAYEEYEEEEERGYDEGRGALVAPHARAEKVSSWDVGERWDVDASADVSYLASGAANSKSGGPCDHCGALESPQWRRGPASKPMLCNACGTRYRRTNTLGPSPLGRNAGNAATEKRKAHVQNDATRLKKNARCVDVELSNLSRSNAVSVTF